MTVLSCKDDNQTIGIVLLVNDTKTTYYLTGAIMPEYKTSGALSWMLWEGIKASINCGRSFNFEGSMIKPIERFFSSFGAKQVPYHRITKANSIVSKAKNLISDI